MRCDTFAGRRNLYAYHLRKPTGRQHGKGRPTYHPSSNPEQSAPPQHADETPKVPTLFTSSALHATRDQSHSQPLKRLLLWRRAFLAFCRLDERPAPQWRRLGTANNFSCLILCSRVRHAQRLHGTHFPLLDSPLIFLLGKYRAIQSETLKRARSQSQKSDERVWAGGTKRRDQILRGSHPLLPEKKRCADIEVTSALRTCVHVTCETA